MASSQPLNTDRKAVIRKQNGRLFRYICPGCGKPLQVHRGVKKNLCMQCGQCLDWQPVQKKWWVEWLVCQNREDAMCCAEKYCEVTRSRLIDPEVYLEKDIPENRWWPKNMYFPFTDEKAYGRFMRWVAKDGPTRLIFGKE